MNQWIYTNHVGTWQTYLIVFQFIIKYTQDYD